jgi:predicted alpha/beta hydrolase family esterase
MPKTVFLLHSAGPQGPGKGSDGFIAILKAALGPGYAVKHPVMPAPDKPDYDTWKVVIGKELAKLENGSVLIGHSLGGSLLLKYLSEEQCSRKFSALFMVAAPFWGLPKWNRAEFILEKGFSRKVTQPGKIFVYHTKDDKIVSDEHVARYTKTIPHATFRTVDGYGHTFAAKACPELIKDIQAL